MTVNILSIYNSEFSVTTKTVRIPEKTVVALLVVVFIFIVVFIGLGVGFVVGPFYELIEA